MSDSNQDGQGSDPFGHPPTGPNDYPDPSNQQSSFPQPPAGQQPPPGQFPPPGQQPPPSQFEPPAHGQQLPPPGQPQYGSSFEPPTSPPMQSGTNNPYPPAQGKKKRRIWPWLVFGIPLLFAMLIGGCSLLFFGAVRGPVDATNAYIANLDNGDFGAAYDGLCSRTRDAVPRATWIAETSTALDGEITGYNFSQVEISGDATVTGTIDIDGVSRNSVFDLVEENGEWRVCQ